MTLLLSFWDPTQGCFLLWTIFHHNFSLFSALTAFLPHPLPWLFSFPCNSVACPGLFTSQGGTVALFPFSPHCLAGIRPPSSSFRRLRRVWSWGVTKPELFKQYLKLGGKGYRLEEGRVNAEKWAWWLFNQCEVSERMNIIIKLNTTIKPLYAHLLHLSLSLSSLEETINYWVPLVFSTEYAAFLLTPLPNIPMFPLPFPVLPLFLLCIYTSLFSQNGQTIDTSLK